jgi:hypothetical protein
VITTGTATSIIIDTGPILNATHGRAHGICSEGERAERAMIHHWPREDC